MLKKDLIFMIYLGAASYRLSFRHNFSISLKCLVVTLVKTQASAPLVLKANKVLFVHHLVVDGGDPLATLTFKPLVVVDGEDQVLKVLQLQAVDGEDVKILLVLLLQVEVPQDHLPNRIL
jgi:hypothetical protein